MDTARKITGDDELRAIAVAGTGFIIDPFNRRWHLAACPHIHRMTTGEPKWFAVSAAALEQFMYQRLAQHPTAKHILACATCGSRAPLAPPVDAERRASGQMADLQAAHPVPIRTVLREIISEHGPAVLSSPAQLANLLADLLPEAPGITKMLAVAAEERVTDQLRDHASAGLDAVTAAKVVASTFASRTFYDQDTCAWLIGELAAALGLLSDAGYTPTVIADQVPETWPAER